MNFKMRCWDNFRCRKKSESQSSTSCNSAQRNCTPARRAAPVCWSSSRVPAERRRRFNCRSAD